MTAFQRPPGSGIWCSKFQLHGKQRWTPGGPWETKRQAIEAERRHRDFLLARRSEETCASFADRWLEEWPRPSAATQRLYAAAAKRFAEHFGPTPIGEVERLSARTWALSVNREAERIKAEALERVRQAFYTGGRLDPRTATGDDIQAVFEDVMLAAEPGKAEIEARRSTDA